MKKKSDPNPKPGTEKHVEMCRATGTGINSM